MKLKWFKDSAPAELNTRVGTRLLSMLTMLISIAWLRPAAPVGGFATDSSDRTK